MYGPVLLANERAVLDVSAIYSRLYGGDGRYYRSSAFVVGHPAALVGALAVQGVLNHHRRVAAEREAAPRWREHQRAQVIATTRRLLCHNTSGWLSSGGSLPPASSTPTCITGASPWPRTGRSRRRCG